MGLVKDDGNFRMDQKILFVLPEGNKSHDGLEIGPLECEGIVSSIDTDYPNDLWVVASKPDFNKYGMQIRGQRLMIRREWVKKGKAKS